MSKKDRVFEAGLPEYPVKGNVVLCYKIQECGQRRSTFTYY